jgi:serine/threonine protein kinase
MQQEERIGRFEVQERLSADSFAIVYRGRDPFDGRRVHIKFCVASDRDIRARFLSAAQRAARLRHANVTTVFEFGSGEAKPYLVEEAFSEECLSDLLARAEPIDDVLKLYYLAQIARGLEYAHSEGVLHRGLCPATVLIDRRGATKITDFATGRIAGAFTRLGDGMGRPPAVGWLVPELLLGLDLDRRSDIYGFGAVVYELLAGRSPFPADSLATLVTRILETTPRPVGVGWPECPPELDRLILRCLARDPRQRFDSMDEVVAELAEIVPVGEPEDVFEEERTVVIDDPQTVYLAKLEQRRRAPEETPLATVAIPRPDVPTAAESRQGRDNTSRQLQRNLRRAGDLMVVGWRATRRQANRAAAAWASRRGPVGEGWRRRTATIVVAALLTFGVVGWSLVRDPDPEPISIPIEAPELPIVSLGLDRGLLLIESQPWGAVERVTDGQGEEVELPASRYTPLSLQLPPGPYTVELSRPKTSGIETCKVVVETAERVRCRLQLAAVDTTQFFREAGWWQ